MLVSLIRLFDENILKPASNCPILRYIDTVFLDRQNHDNQINAKCEKNLVHYIEFGCLLLNE